MVDIKFEDDKSFIEIVKNSIKKARTKRGAFFLALYVLAFIFAMAALTLTVYTLQNVGGSESVQSTRITFREYGYALGSLIIALQNFLVIFFIPFFGNFIFSILEGESYHNYVSIIVFPIIEAYAFFQLSARFLDMLTDVAAFQILTNTTNFFNWHYYLLTEKEIISISLRIYFITLIALVAIRVLVYFKKKMPTKKGLGSSSMTETQLEYTI